MSTESSDVRGLLARPDPLDEPLARRVSWALSLVRTLDATPAIGSRRLSGMLHAVREAFDATAASTTVLRDGGDVEREHAVGWNAGAGLARAARRLPATTRDGDAVIEDVARLGAHRSARLFLHRSDGPPFVPAAADWLRVIHAGCAWAYETPAAVDADAISEGRPADGSRLSRPARETLDLLLVGASEKDVATRLRRSRHTVHTHVKQIYRAYGVRSRPELLARFLHERDLDPAGPQ